MEIKKGIAVSPGIAISRAVVFDSQDYRIPRRSILPSQCDAEVKRVRNSFAVAVSELNEIERSKDINEGNIKDIFAVHMRFLRDRSLRKKICTLVEKDLIAAEYAVSVTMREIAAHFANIKDTYISERATDIYDIEKRLLKHLLGENQQSVDHLNQECVIVAHDLTPTQTAGFDRHFVKGFATNAGGRTSHTAIVARSLGIPAVVALEDISDSIESGNTVIIDGNRGVVVVNPDVETLEQYEIYYADFTRLGEELDSIREMPARTRDGVEIALHGNIEFPDESEVVIQKGGSGVGLYRTEFLYLQSKSEPTEEEHYDAYIKVLESLKGKPIVIRTMDLGADKVIQNNRFPTEMNPVLGLRSIRYCLQHMLMFKTQLRAILRASAVGDVRVMFPLISNLQELCQAKMILRDVMEDLAEYCVPYNPDIKIGMMVETPSAALTASMFARECDFFSIGTNDLIQYTLAVDRANERVATLYSANDPAVLRLLRNVVYDASKSKIGLSVCGEMASEPGNVLLLLGMGVRALSIAPSMIPEIKKVIRSVTIQHCNSLARQALAMNSKRQVSNLLRDAAIKILPEAF